MLKAANPWSKDEVVLQTVYECHDDLVFSSKLARLIFLHGSVASGNVLRMAKLSHLGLFEKCYVLLTSSSFPL